MSTITNSNKNLNPIMNDTKWEEIRLAFYGLGKNSPRWRTKNVETGYISDWDGEWFYHFREGGYSTIEYLEILTPDPEIQNKVREILANIHVPGSETNDGFVVYGHIQSGEYVDYIKSS